MEYEDSENYWKFFWKGEGTPANWHYTLVEVNKRFASTIDEAVELFQNLIQILITPPLGLGHNRSTDSFWIRVNGKELRIRIEIWNNREWRGNGYCRSLYIQD